MNILSIDIGSYSIKFLSSRLERKRLVNHDSYEVIIDSVKEKYNKSTLQQIQLEIIRKFITETSFEGKIIYQLPNEMITSRFLSIPITNRKKVEMMVPFQLDENLPYPLSTIHFISDFHKKLKTTSVIVSVAPAKSFEQYYDMLGQNNVLPAVLTSELAIIQNFITASNINSSICILDMGHSTSNAYFIKDREIVSNHTSHIGGKIIDDVISQTYQISMSEAINYKHDNCFLLTEGQYNEVNKEQQEFAKLMKQAIWPLVSEMKRWSLGFRVKYTLPVEKIYLIGGSSNINNICNFLTQSTSIETEHIDNIMDTNILLKKDDIASYAMSGFMASSQLMKHNLPNFLTGGYTSNQNNEIPLYSAVFIASRAIILGIIFILSLFFERYFLKDELKTLNSQITKQLKTPGLNISKRDQRNFKKHPEKILKILKKRNEQLIEKTKAVKTGLDVNAIKPLAQISKILSNNKKASLEIFKNDGINVFASFSGASNALTSIEDKLKNSNFKDIDVKNDLKKNVLTIKFRGN